MPEKNLTEDESVKTDILIELQNPFFHNKERDNLFLEAMQESFSHHYNSCPVYQTICRLEGFSPEHFQSYDDIFHIPHLFVTVLRKRKITSIPDDEVEIVIKSSDVGGEVTNVYLDAISLNRTKRIFSNIYSDLGIADPEINANYILFSHKQENGEDSESSFCQKLLCGLTSVRRLLYALTRGKNTDAYEADMNAVFESLEQFAADNLPVRITGSPEYLYKLQKEFDERNLKPLSFGENSFVIIREGWKVEIYRDKGKSELVKRISHSLGIPAHNVREQYGIAEYGIPYCECEYGRMHIPVYSRVVVRDPETMRILPDNTPGLFHFYTPYLHSFPAISLLTNDLGMISEGCKCGRNAPFIEVIGTAGIAERMGLP